MKPLNNFNLLQLPYATSDINLNLYLVTGKKIRKCGGVPLTGLTPAYGYACDLHIVTYWFFFFLYQFKILIINYYFRKQ